MDGSILKVISYCTRLNISLNRNVSHSHRTSVIDGQCKISGQEGEREADGVICSSAYPCDIFQTQHGDICRIPLSTPDEISSPSENYTTAAEEVQSTNITDIGHRLTG